MAVGLNEPCPICGEKGKRLCPICKDIKYCSQECQEADWQAHKLLHTTLETLPKGPSSQHHRVLLFSSDAAGPEFLWLPTKEYVNDDGSVYQQPDMDEQFGEKKSVFDSISRNPMSDAPLGYELQIAYTEGFAEVYKTDNRAVTAATGNNEGQRRWRGPIIAYRLSTTGNISDMDMGSYSHTIAFLIDEGTMTVRHFSRKEPKVKVVKILCDGEMVAAARSSRFLEIELTRRHPALTSAFGDHVPISQAIDMPLVVAKGGKASKRWDPSNEIVSNMLISIRHFDHRDGFRGLGKQPEWWNVYVGSVFMFRRDFEPLSIESAEAFAAFCRRIRFFLERTADDYDGLGGPLTEEEAFSELTHEKWQIFFARFKEDRPGVVNEVHEEIGFDADDLINSLRGMKLEDAEDGVERAVPVDD